MSRRKKTMPTRGKISARLVLIVDDHPMMRQGLAQLIDNEPDLKVCAEADTAGHSLPQGKWSTMAGLRRDTMNIVYCYAQNCHMGANAAMQFAAKGYSVMEMDGGFESWQENGLKIVK